MSPKRKILVTGLLILLIPSGLAADTGLDAEIVRECQSAYEPVISMADPVDTYSNPGPPDMYEHKLCIQGIDESIFSTSCEKSTGFYISSKNRTAHFSQQNSYYWKVCTGRMSTRISSGPKTDNETKLFSVSDTHNGHVAEPGVFKYNVYGSYNEPENVTLELEFNLSSSDNVYFDGAQVDGAQDFYPPAAFPYLISESDSEAKISGIITTSFTKASRSFSNSKNRLSITRSGSGDFILPFTSGDINDVNDKENDITSSKFMNSVNPNFGYGETSTPTIKTRLVNTNIISDISISAGTSRINVTKTGENEVTIKEAE